METENLETRDVTIQNRDGLPIHGTLHLPSEEGERPLVLVAHGFKGFREWGFFPWLGDRLARAGLAAFRFDFSRNGVEESSPTEFTRLDLFEQNSISREIADLMDVLDALPSHPGFEGYRRERFGLFGHSRGGSVAILVAARRKEVGSLVTWSAVSRFDDAFSPEVIEQWKREGKTTVKNSRTGQDMPLGTDLLKDLTERKEELDVLAAQARLHVPQLIIHGEEDESVPVLAAEELHRASGSKAAIHVVPGTGHTFGVVHPFEGETDELVSAEEATSLHFRITLR